MQVILLISILLFSSQNTTAQTTAAAASPSTSSSNAIDARKFESFPLRQSKTGRVIVFKTNSPAELPKPGKLVLLRSNGKPIFAFRVIQSNDKTSEYVARKIRRYDQSPELAPGQGFESIEKVNDVWLNTSAGTDMAVETAPTPIAATPTVATSSVQTPTEPTPLPPETAAPETAEPTIDQTTEETKTESKTETKSEDLEALPYDSELDKTTSPDESEPDKKPLDYEDEVIEEIPHYFPDSMGIGIQAGFYTNLSNFALSGPIANGTQATFSFLLGQDWFAVNQSPQDRMMIELGAGFYRLIDLSGNLDNYTIVPFRAELRYELDFSPSIAWNFYVGFQYNWLAQSSNAIRSVANGISGPQQTVGTGLTFRIGPHWYVRPDLGWDRMTISLMLQW